MERQEPGRRALGREKFLEKVWAWKAESGGAIINQLKRLGASCDWSRERFTMDEGLSRAVAQGVRGALSRRPDLQGQAAGQLGPEAARPRSPTSRCSRSRSRAISGTSNIRSKMPTRRVHHRRDDAPGDHAGRHRRRGASRRRALQASDRQDGDPAAGRPPHSDHRRRIFRSGERHRRGQDHAGARLQRFRGRPPPRAADDQCSRRRRPAQSARQRSVSAGVPPSAELNETLSLHGIDRFAARKRIVELMEARGLLDKIEPTHAHGAAWRPLGRRDRAVPHRPMVCRRQDAGAAGDRRRCASGKTAFVPDAMGSDLLQLDGEHPALVHFPPALVGPSNPGLVRPGRQVFVAESEDDAVRRQLRALRRQSRRSRSR